MKQYRKILWFILYWITYSGLIGRYLIQNELLGFIPDVLIFFLYFWRPKGLNYKSASRFWGKPISYTIGVFFAFSIIGGLINFVPIPTFLWGLRMLLRYILLFIIIKRCFKPQDAQRYKRYIYQWFNINMLFCVLQFFQGQRYDLMGGTFRGNGLLLLMLFISLIIFSGDFFHKKLSTYKYLIRIGCVLVIAIWAELKFAYFVSPLIIYGSYVLLRKFNFTHLIVLGIAFLMLVPTLQFFMSFYYDETYVNMVFDPEFIKEETTHAYGFQDGFNRSTAIEMTNELLLTDTKSKIFGHGLGSGTQSFYFQTLFYEKWAWTTYYNFSTSYILTELGWIGFILFCFIYLIALIKFYTIYKKAKVPNQKYWSTAGILAVCVSILMFWYNDSAYFNFYLMYFFWAICATTLLVTTKTTNHDKSIYNRTYLQR